MFNDRKHTARYRPARLTNDTTPPAIVRIWFTVCNLALIVAVILLAVHIYGLVR